MEQYDSPVISESSSFNPYIGAIILGTIGAIIGGALWAGVAIVADLEIGVLAILVGALAGYGVLLGSGKRGGATFQLIAVVAAIIGIILGKYFSVYYFVRENTILEFGQELWDELGYSILSSEFLQDFIDIVPETIGFLDVLFVGLAIYTAYGIPKERERVTPQPAETL